MTTHSASIDKGSASKYLTFAISRERYGVEILKVQEIIGVPHVMRVPKVPDYIKGVINLRGKIIPLIELRSKFGIESVPYDEKTCIIVVNISKGEQKLSIGVIVDTVLEVMSFLPEEIEPAPDYGAQLDARFITGMGKKDTSTLNILIDIEKVLTDHKDPALMQLAEKSV